MTPPSSQMLQILKKGRCNFMFYVLHFFQFFLTELESLQKNENFEYKLEIFWTFFSKSHYSYIYNDSLKFNFEIFPKYILSTIVKIQLNSFCLNFMAKNQKLTFFIEQNHKLKINFSQNKLAFYSGITIAK